MHVATEQEQKIGVWRKGKRNCFKNSFLRVRISLCLQEISLTVEQATDTRQTIVRLYHFLRLIRLIVGRISFKNETRGQNPYRLRGVRSTEGLDGSNVRKEVQFLYTSQCIRNSIVEYSALNRAISVQF